MFKKEEERMAIDEGEKRKEEEEEKKASPRWLSVAVNVIYSTRRRMRGAFSQNPFREKRIAAMNTLRRLFYENRGRQGAKFKGKRGWIYDRGIRHAKLNETFLTENRVSRLRRSNVSKSRQNQLEDKGKEKRKRERGEERGTDGRTDAWKI